MGKAVCCDRCGKFQKIVPNARADGWNVLNGSGPSVSDPMGQVPETLLCPECAAMYEQFLYGYSIPARVPRARR